MLHLGILLRGAGELVFSVSSIFGPVFFSFFSVFLSAWIWAFGQNASSFSDVVSNGVFGFNIV